MAVRPLHISKYILGYQELYPSSPILLVRGVAADLLWRLARHQRRVTIFDSYPGRGIFSRARLALSSSLPASPLLEVTLVGLIYLVLALYWLAYVPIGCVRRALNDPTQMRDARRCYVYSEEDPMVGWHDVEDHANEAERRGFVVQTEKFSGSGHCAHVWQARGETS